MGVKKKKEKKQGVVKVATSRAVHLCFYYVQELIRVPKTIINCR